MFETDSAIHGDQQELFVQTKGAQVTVQVAACIWL